MNQKHKDWKEEVKLLLQIVWLFTIEKSKKTIHKLLEIIEEFSEVVRFKTNKQNLLSKISKYAMLVPDQYDSPAS